MPSEVSVGDYVRISGTTETYAGMKQIADPVINTIVSSDNQVTYPDPVVLDADAADALVASPEKKYIQFTGILDISGSYYNVTIDGASSVGSISYPADDLSEYDGKAVTITGYFNGVSGGRYLNIFYTEIEEAPYCTVSPATLSVGAEAGTTTFNISSNESWTISTSNENYKLSETSGNGDAEITVTYPANETDEAITVTFTVTSDSGKKTVTLTQASASQITVTWNTVDPTTQSWTSETHDTYGNGYAYSDQGIKVGYYQYESTTKPNITSSGHIRVYKSSELVISAENGGIIKSVTLECSDSKYCGDLSVSDGSVAVATTSAPYKITWSGSVDVFEAQAAEKQVRITKITVVYE